MFLRGATSVVILLVMTSIVVACTGVVPSVNQSGGRDSHAVGTVHIAALAPQSVHGDYYAKATLENEGMKREVALNPFDGGFAAVMTGLPIGDWLLSIELYDALGDLTHAAEQSVRVYQGKESRVQLQVRPVDAILEIVADLSDFAERTAIEGVRVTFSGGSYFTLTPVEDTPFTFHGQRHVEAGDYEFSVAFYGESFYAADRIYQSPWESVRLYSGKTTQLHWTPSFGSTEVHIDIMDPPSAPTGIGCLLSSDGLEIMWDADSVPVGGHVRIYALKDEYRPFSLLAQQDGEEGRYLLDSKDENSLAIVLTHVNKEGIESFRSEPLFPWDCGI